MPHPKLIGSRFEVHELLGEGSMGVVYAGLDTHTGQRVAIKALKAARPDADTQIVERFVREGEALRRLDHPNIVKVLAIIKESRQHFIVMEHVGNASLHSLMHEKGQLPIRQVLEIALDLSDALIRAHRLEIIHRDIKPANVLLAPDGTPRLTDFGVAQMGDMVRVTQPGTVIGTYAYLSPEACSGQSLDARSDIWSFGIMLYEMLAGRHPFDTSQYAALLMQILRQPVPSLKQFRPDAPNTLANLIHRMLEKDRDFRVQSVRVVGAELEAILRGSDLSSDRGTPMQLHTQQVGARPDSNGSAANPPTPTPTPTPSTEVRHNLPAQPTPFIGRGPELDDIMARLRSPDCRLLTLNGPGGIGKTRLALEAAANILDDYTDGVWFVPLAPLTDPELIVQAIGEALPFAFYPGAAEPGQQLRDFLQEKHLLLVLDNVEHVLASAYIITDVLNAAPGVKVLATSRARLNLQGEWLVQVQGMHYPDSADFETNAVENFSALGLFLACARRIDASFVLSAENKPQVTRILHLLEGMPLGIELAAAWLHILSIEEIADEITQSLDFLESNTRDMPERHRSLRAVFEYSWNLLSAQEQETFCQMTVFQGTFSREAVRAVTGATLRVLSGLLDKSLLARTDDGLYRQHNLLRQFAAEKLAVDPAIEVAVQNRHRAYYMQFLQEQEADLKGSAQAAALDAIEASIENVRVAWKRAAQQCQQDEIAAALEALYLFHDMRGWFEPGMELIHKALKMVCIQDNNPDHQIMRARLLTREAIFLMNRGQPQATQDLLRESLDLMEEARADYERAYTLYILGGFLQKHQPEQACTIYEEALDIYRRHNDLWGIARALTSLSGVAIQMEQIEKANQRHAESLEAYDACGDHWGKGVAILGAASFYYQDGNLAEAKARYNEAKQIFWQLGDRYRAALVFNQMGYLSIWYGDYDEARRRFTKALEIHKELGNKWSAITVQDSLGDVAFEQGDYEEAQRIYAQCLAEARQLDTRLHGQPPEFFWQMQLGKVTLARGHYATAREYYVRCVALINAQTTRSIVQLADVYSRLAQATWLAGDPGAAREHFRKALAYATSVSDPVPQLVILLNYAQLLMMTHRDRVALRLLAFLQTQRLPGHDVLSQVQKLQSAVKARFSAADTAAIQAAGQELSLQEAVALLPVA